MQAVMQMVREFLDGRAGRMASLGFAAVAVLLLIWVLIGRLGESEAAALSRERTYIDATTGEAFEYSLHAGDRIPVPAPSGANTGYPAEWCYWSRDGQLLDDPTPVLLNRYKGIDEPTFCPACGRLVVARNPAPLPGATPPPTREQFAARSQRSSHR